MTRQRRPTPATRQIEQLDAEARRRYHEAVVGARRCGETPGCAAIEPAHLARLLHDDPAAAWLNLASLTGEQLVVEAIDYTAWLNETTGRDLAWGEVLSVFERRIARLEQREAA
jgi:hypothetical protein